MEEPKLPIYLYQDGVHVMVLMTLEELELFNKRTEELEAQDQSWSERHLDIANKVIDECRARKD